MKKRTFFEKKHRRKMKKTELPESDFYEKGDTRTHTCSRTTDFLFHQAKGLIPKKYLPATGTYQPNHTLNQNPTEMNEERTGSKPIPRGPRQYDGSHILRTPVLSELCFLLHKINFAAKNELAPNRDVGGGGKLQSRFPGWKAYRK